MRLPIKIVLIAGDFCLRHPLFEFVILICHD